MGLEPTKWLLSRHATFPEPSRIRWIIFNKIKYSAVELSMVLLIEHFPKWERKGLHLTSSESAPFLLRTNQSTDMVLEIFWNYIRPQNSKFALTLISTMYICTHTYMSEKQLLNADAINLTHIKILEGELLWQVKDDHNGSFENPLEHIQIQIKVTQSKRLSLKRQKMKFISARFFASSWLWSLTERVFFLPFFNHELRLTTWK